MQVCRVRRAAVGFPVAAIENPVAAIEISVVVTVFPIVAVFFAGVSGVPLACPHGPTARGARRVGAP